MTAHTEDARVELKSGHRLGARQSARLTLPSSCAVTRDATVNTAVRRFFQGAPVLHDLYSAARTRYQRRRLLKSAGRYFTDPNRFLMAWQSKDGPPVALSVA